MAGSGITKLMTRPWVAVTWRYGLAFATLTAALVLHLTFLHFHLPDLFAAFALSAIAITVCFGGTKPGIVVVLLLALIRGYFGEPGITTSSQILYDLVFVAFAVLISWLRRSRIELEAKVVNQFRLAFDTIPTLAWSTGPDGSADFFNQRWLDYTGFSAGQATDWGWKVAIHPDDLPRMLELFQQAVKSAQPFEVEGRLRRFDGEFRWFLFRGSPLRDDSGRVVKWYGTNTDLEDRKRGEDALRASEQSFRQVVDSIPGMICTMTAAGGVERVNQRILDYTGKTLEELKDWAPLLHEEDRALVIAQWGRSVQTGQPYDLEHRILGADGVHRWFHVRGLPLQDEEGRIGRWYILLTEIDERKNADVKLRQSEADLLEAQRFSHTGSWKHDLSSGTVSVSPEVHRIFGIKPGQDASAAEFYFGSIYPEDRKRTQELFEKSEIEKIEYQADYRIVLPDGTIRHQHAIGHPILNDAGDLVEFVGTVMVDTEQWQAQTQLEKAFEEIKRLKDRLHDENLVLREQIDQAFMFEEIVGSSPPLQALLSSIVKVGPTDSTVLITGETGTGKELIARAIHKRSQRCGQAFISVNCASIPSSLIASELFGHEKGAFTGALHLRQGRFELAHSGTIFLDEIGDLPAETQVALLRVLQERQFERVGGNRVIPADVRIITATNRDLSAAIAAGAFRADLFYRLNVFPIHVPPLRDRKEDIPMLVEYFVKRFAEKMGKQIRKIDKTTLEQCQAYPWPGNIRELQNIIERSVILCGGDTFWLIAAWLTSQASPRRVSSPLTETLQNQEKRIIEAALAGSRGKVAGPDGAAAKLGIPPSTLDSKIKQFKIEKHKFTPAD
jgi:PAS domain S-box-containing protein